MTNATHTRLKLLHAMLSPSRLTAIVDVGANPINAPDYKAMFECGLVRVIGFEPQEEAFRKLESAAGENARFYPDAVGDGRHHELKLCHSTGFTSLLEPNAKAYNYLGRFQWKARVRERVPVATRRLDDIDDLGEVDLLKIDIQGGELDVFRNARKTLADCTAVMTEVAFIPLYIDQPLIDAQMAELREQGFLLHKFMFAKALPMPSPLKANLKRRAMLNQLIDGDAVFVRDLLNIDTASDERLKHLALLADGCFGSFDLAVRCLSHLIDRGVLTEADCQDYLKFLEDV